MSEAVPAEATAFRARNREVLQARKGLEAGAGGPSDDEKDRPAELDLEDESLEQMPPGSWGAGGWHPGGLGDYPRFTPEEAAAARYQFRWLIKKRFYSSLRAWKAYDTDGNGRLSIFEWMRACQDMEVTSGSRNLWDAFDTDRSGFISFNELDPDAAKVLENLAVVIRDTCGTLDKAWHEVFNQRGFSYRIPYEAFELACGQLGFGDSVPDAWFHLCTDRAHAGLSRDEYRILNLWLMEQEPKLGPLSDEAYLEQMARLGDNRDKHKDIKKKTMGEAKADFKALLLKSYGNYVRAWREGLDFDHSGSIDYDEFAKACKNIGYAGSRAELWKELDCDGNGNISMKELCESTATLLQGLYACAVKCCGTWGNAWEDRFDTRGDNRVPIRKFVEGCRSLNFKGNAEAAFELLDLDRCKYLTLESTAWIGGTEEQPKRKNVVEMIGDLAISGNYRLGTRSRRLKEGHFSREHRFRLEKFDRRARGELHGTNVAAGSSPSGKYFIPQSPKSQLEGSGVGYLGATGGDAGMSRDTGALDEFAASDGHPGDHVAMAEHDLGLVRRISGSGPAGKQQDQGAMELDLSLLSHTRASKHRMEAKDLPEFPDYLVSPTSTKFPDSEQPASPSSPASPMWSPGRGGWQGQKDRVMDANWGGGKSSLYVGSGVRAKKTDRIQSRRNSAASICSFEGSEGELSMPGSPSSRLGSMPGSPLGGTRTTLPGLAEGQATAQQRKMLSSLSAPSLSRWRALSSIGL